MPGILYINDSGIPPRSMEEYNHWCECLSRVHLAESLSDLGSDVYFVHIM
ncbi:unnamed protein product [Penicillium roqueforti FM164]|uniref:Genomic scaffold, ProqFM164S02 n=1 Tax=Penicillium roqueforti (strain FM164) TaxID=1365484 RepID=W6QP31_PENRF|nr:unnamed protein product [Penicillium roqueforti FM164]